MSSCLQPHRLQHARLPCPSLSPGVCSNSCPLSWWCHATISFSVTLFSSCPQSFPASESVSSELALWIRWPKDWSFSFSPSNEYSGLISFRIDWLNLLAVQGTLQESFPAPQFESINSSVLSLLYGTTLTSVHDSGKSKALTIWTIVDSTLDSKEIKSVSPKSRLKGTSLIPSSCPRVHNWVA